MFTWALGADRGACNDDPLERVVTSHTQLGPDPISSDSSPSGKITMDYVHRLGIIAIDHTHFCVVQYIYFNHLHHSTSDARPSRQRDGLPL